jgi:hypothetical protein
LGQTRSHLIDHLLHLLLAAVPAGGRAKRAGERL